MEKYVKNLVFIILILIFTNPILSNEYKWKQVDKMPDNLVSNYNCLFVKDSLNMILGGSRNFTYPMTRYTTNGGISWQFGFVDSSFIPFLNAKSVVIKKVFWGEGKNVIAFADSGYYYRTNDLINWEKKQLPILDVYLIQDADFVQNNIIITYSNIVFQSIDFGYNWEIVYNHNSAEKKTRFSKLKILNISDFLFSSFDTPSSQEYYFNKFKKNKWELISQLPTFLNTLDLIGSNIYYTRNNVNGYNNVYHSIDEGKNWNTIYSLDFSKHNRWMSPTFYKDSIFSFSQNDNYIFKCYDIFTRVEIDSGYSNLKPWQIKLLSNIDYNKMILANDQAEIYIYSNDKNIGVSVENTPELLYNPNNTLIFPNPSSEKISLDLGGVELADLVVYDILGNEIMSIPNYTNKSEIDISTLSKGTYLIKIQHGNNTKTVKVVVN